MPDLASAVPQPTDGGLTYSFRLRPGLRYSTGLPVRASDFRRQFERLYATHSDAAGLYSSLRGASSCTRAPARCDLRAGVVTDDRAATVVFHLARPDPELLFKLTQTGARPAPPGTPKGELARTPIPGTGPYRVGELRPRATSPPWCATSASTSGRTPLSRRLRGPHRHPNERRPNRSGQVRTPRRRRPRAGGRVSGHRGPPPAFHHSYACTLSRTRGSSRSTYGACRSTTSARGGPSTSRSTERRSRSASAAGACPPPRVRFCRRASPDTRLIAPGLAAPSTDTGTDPTCAARAPQGAERRGDREYLTPCPTRANGRRRRPLAAARGGSDRPRVAVVETGSTRHASERTGAGT